MLERQCEECGEPYRIPSFEAWRRHRFCSELCRKRAEGKRYRLRKRGEA